MVAVGIRVILFGDGWRLVILCNGDICVELLTE